jgi:hypothetical protein
MERLLEMKTRTGDRGEAGLAHLGWIVARFVSPGVFAASAMPQDLIRVR